MHESDIIQSNRSVQLTKISGTVSWQGCSEIQPIGIGLCIGECLGDVEVYFIPFFSSIKLKNRLRRFRSSIAGM